MKLSKENFAFGVQVVIKKGSQVLLTKREDFEVWCLPGGSLNSHETFVEAAVREAREETGLEVRVTRLIGAYSRPTENCYNLAFEAEVISGIPTTSREVVALEYFDQNQLPDFTIFFYRRMIADAFMDTLVPTAWKLITPAPFGAMHYLELYALRDASGLSRKDFYMKHFGNSDEYQEIREV